MGEIANGRPNGNLEDEDDDEYEDQCAPSACVKRRWQADWRDLVGKSFVTRPGGCGTG
jgi:hypothetical protein